MILLLLLLKAVYTAPLEKGCRLPLDRKARDSERSDLTCY